MRRTCRRTKERAKQLEMVGPFWLLRAEPRRALACFHSLAMGMTVLAGVGVAAAELRARVVRQSRLRLQSQCPEDLAAAEAILAELRDEPTWDFSIAFTWARFLDFLALPRSYTTTWALQQFVLMEHINVRSDTQCKHPGSVGGDSSRRTARCHFRVAN